MKLCDFALANINDCNKLDEDLTDYVSLRYYKAPEILLGSNVYGQPADMWSLGCILVEMFTGEVLFRGTSPLNQIMLIIKYTGKPTLDDISSLKSQLAKGYLEHVKYENGEINNPTSINSIEQIPDDEGARDLIKRLLIFNPSKRILYGNH